MSRYIPPPLFTSPSGDSCTLICFVWSEYNSRRRLEKQSGPTRPRLRVVPHFPSGIVERVTHERAWKSPQARKAISSLCSPRLAFLAWGEFHALSRFASSPRSLHEPRLNGAVWQNLPKLPRLTDITQHHRTRWFLCLILPHCRSTSSFFFLSVSS